MRWPQAYSTMLGAHGKESGYATKENGGIDSVMEVDVRVSEKTWNGAGNLELDWNVFERRPPKRTEKSKVYWLTERKGKETSSKEKYSHGLLILEHLWDLTKIWS